MSVVSPLCLVTVDISEIGRYVAFGGKTVDRADVGLAIPGASEICFFAPIPSSALNPIGGAQTVALAVSVFALGSAAV